MNSDSSKSKMPFMKLNSIRHWPNGESGIPSRPAAFSPIVEHNGEGGWRFAHEQPEEWTSGLYVLKRIDPGLAAFDEGRLEALRKITDTSISRLHHLAEENRGLPARFKDSVERFRIEQKLTDFIADMEKGDTRRAEYAQEQLHTLPSLPGWPADRYIEVLDNERKITAMYPPTTLVPDEELSVEVTEAQLARGELLDTVVAGLYQSEIEGLLGKNVAKGTESGLLAKKIGAAVKADRKSVFKHLYQRYDQNTVSDVQKIRSVFPELPAGLAQELIDSHPPVPNACACEQQVGFPWGWRKTSGKCWPISVWTERWPGFRYPKLPRPTRENWPYSCFPVCAAGATMCGLSSVKVLPPAH